MRVVCWMMLFASCCAFVVDYPASLLFVCCWLSSFVACCLLYAVCCLLCVAGRVLFVLFFGVCGSLCVSRLLSCRL